MKIRDKILQRKKTSLAGFGLTGIGLVCVVILLAQLGPALMGGRGPELSSVQLGIESTVALICLISGFALMVVGADPFEDIDNDFDFNQD